MSIWVDRIKEALRWPVETKARPSRAALSGRILPTLPVASQLQRVGGGLTPQQVSAIIRMADTGDMRPLMDLANETRQKDCHLQSVLATSEESIAGLEWELVPPRGANRKEVKACAAIEQWMRSYDGLRRALAHHAGARFYGYAVTQIGWIKSKGLILPEYLSAESQRRFGYDAATGALVWRDSGSSEGVDLRAEYPHRFIISQPRITGDVPCREGLVRVLMWAALFRNWAMSDWLRLGEIAWKPWRTGKYTKDATAEDIDTLTTILEQMTSSGVAMFPDTVDVQIEWAKGDKQHSNHAELFDTVGREMSKCVLGQTESTESTRVGNYAAARMKNEIRKDLREASAKYVAADFTRDLIGNFIRINYGDAVRAPWMRFITEEAQDLAQFALGVKTLVDAGAKIPVKWVNDQAGIPDRQEGEEVLGGGNLAPAPVPTPNDGT